MLVGFNNVKKLTFYIDSNNFMCRWIHSVVCKTPVCSSIAMFNTWNNQKIALHPQSHASVSLVPLDRRCRISFRRAVQNQLISRFQLKTKQFWKYVIFIFKFITYLCSLSFSSDCNIERCTFDVETMRDGDVPSYHVAGVFTVIFSGYIWNEECMIFALR